jgi:hypothetical protein
VRGSDGLGQDGPRERRWTGTAPARQPGAFVKIDTFLEERGDPQWR